MDVESGEVLYGKNVDQRLPIASLTKIMTALVASESGKLDEIVTVHPDAVKVEPTAIWLTPGEKITLRDLVYGLMLRSGNDAALAIAYHLAGNVAAFCDIMNSRAQELGAVNTSFRNPHGLPDKNHFSSAYDLGLITRAALLNPFVKQVVASERYESTWDGHSQVRIWHNKNRLLQLMPEADGVKTGWTVAAGHCLASSATRAGWQLLSIVLNSPDHYGENRALLEWGLANFRQVQLVSPGLFQGYVKVKNGKPATVGAVTTARLNWVVARGEELSSKLVVELPEELELPVYQGQTIGEMVVQIDGRDAARIPLIADNSSIDKSWWRRLWQSGLNYVRFVHQPLRLII